jgi:peptide deformylase
MAKLTILEYPDPRLRTRAAPVTVFDQALGQLAEDMLETMYNAKGVGLAATQVNVHKRMLVADVSEERKSPLVLCNPRLVEAVDKSVSGACPFRASSRRSSGHGRFGSSSRT